MPAVNDHPDDYLKNLLKALADRITALETQQSFGVRDSKGVRRILAGQQADGSFGITVFDALGSPSAVFGDLGGGVTAGPYGLATLPAGTAYAGRGSLQRVGGAVLGATMAQAGVTACGDTAFPGAPAGDVTVAIGPSGSALVNLQAVLATGGSANGAFVGVGLDGGGAQAPWCQASVSGSGVSGVLLSQSTTRLWTGLTQGQHTFRALYSVSNAGIVGFSRVIVTVQPL